MISWANVHTPTVPRSFSSEAGQVDIVVSLGTVTRGVRRTGRLVRWSISSRWRARSWCSRRRRPCGPVDAGLSADPGLPGRLGGRRAPGPGHRRAAGAARTAGVVGVAERRVAESARVRRWPRVVGRSRTWRWSSSPSTRDGSCAARWPSAPVAPLSIPRRARRRLRLVVANGDAVPVPPARHATGEERRLRAAGRVSDSTCGALSTTPLHAPVVLFIHGGSWMMGDKREQGRPMLHEFVRRGWIAVVPNYRLAPRHPWPAQIRDVTRALGWVKKNVATYGGDPERVVIAGGSAGGTTGGPGGADGQRPDVATAGRDRRHRLVGARRHAVLRRVGDDGRRDALARSRSRTVAPARASRSCRCPIDGQRAALSRDVAVRAHQRRRAAVLRSCRVATTRSSTSRWRATSSTKFRDGRLGSDVLRGAAVHAARLRHHGQSPNVGDDARRRRLRRVGRAVAHG